MSNPDGYYGTERAENRSSEYNAIAFIVRSILAGRAHVGLVEVVGIDGKLLDVRPLVNQLDAAGNAIPHGVLSGVPFMTLQAGGNAVTMTPEVGDNGLCLFADRDISSVIANRGQANPGSMRQSSMSDALYIGGFLNDDPTQFVEFTSAGIRIHSPTRVLIEAPRVQIDAPDGTTINGPFTVNGKSQFNGDVASTGTISADVDVLAAGKSGKSHNHRAQGANAITTPPL